MATKVIWKYQLATGLNPVEMPGDARVLSAHGQRDEVCIWALVDPERPVETRRFWVLGTGHTTDPAVSLGAFIGTALLYGDSIVLHVFEAA